MFWDGNIGLCATHNGYLTTEDDAPPDYIVAVFRADAATRDLVYDWVRETELQAQVQLQNTTVSTPTPVAMQAAGGVQ